MSVSRVILKKMPPEGGDLFIGGGAGVGGDSVDDGDVYSRDDIDGNDPVSQVAFDPPPSEYECEDNDLAYIS